MAQKKYVSLTRLEQYHEKEVLRTAAEAAATLKSAKDYADSLATNYDAAGSATGALEAAKEYADGKDAAIAEAKKAGTDAAAAAGVADGKAVEAKNAADAAQADVDALETYIGTFTHETAKSVVEYINAKTAGIATDAALGELQATVAQQGKDIDAIEADYLKSSDKTELEGKINAKADQTALDGVSAVANAAVKQADYDVKVKALEDEDARIVGLVEAEAERAAGVEDGLKGRIETMEAFWEAAKADGDEGNVIDTLKEIQEYIAGDDTGASEMLASIQKNAKDIADHIATDHDFAGADAALKAELEGKINVKADNSALTELAGRVTTAEGEIDTLQTDLGTAQAAIEALQTAVGDGGSVDEMIDSAIETAMGEEEARVDALLANKVDKVDGKGLSTNDLTNELKGQYDAAYAHSQVAHAPADAQKNIIEAVKVNGTALTITDKTVDITVPTKVSELTNDVPYLVAADIANKADKATTLAGYGITDAYTNAQVDTAIANAVGQFIECSEEDINSLFQ